jgi:hypothetical protein
VKQQIVTQKFTLTVIWEINGFHVIDLMTEQHSYNTQYFLNHILEPLLLAVFPDGGKPHSHRLSLHLDDCRVRYSKPSENFSLEIMFFEYSIQFTVLAWHLLTSGFSAT